MEDNRMYIHLVLMKEKPNGYSSENPFSKFENILTKMYKFGVKVKMKW